MPIKAKSEKVPEAMRPVYETITALTNEFCDKHLNEEYAQLARQMTAALCRKRRGGRPCGRRRRGVHQGAAGIHGEKIR